jgi:NADH:ubiquinone oxidoreductase subunit 6 (subunit J)
MIVRVIVFLGAIILFAIVALMMYGDLKANRKKIDRSIKKKKNQYSSEYQKSYK